MALLGAVAAAGCGGAGSSNPSSNTGNRGIEGTKLKVDVRGEKAVMVTGAWDTKHLVFTPALNASTGAATQATGTFDPAAMGTIIVPGGGLVTGTGINCGQSGANVFGLCSTQVVYNEVDDYVLVATTSGLVEPLSLKPYMTWGWAGACSGTDGCKFKVTDNRMVAIRFATSAAALGAHGPFTAHQIHGAEYLKLTQGVAGAYDCTACHGGAALTGLGLAPSCATCHTWPLAPHMIASGHNSGQCARCHSSDGFRDFIGADGSASNIANVQYSGTDVTTVCVANGALPCLDTNKVLGTNATTVYYANGFRCDACHNGATVLGGGTLNQHTFPRGNAVTMDGNTAICSQCHDGGRPGYEVSKLLAQSPELAYTTAPDTQLTGTNNKTVRAHYLPAASSLFGADASNWYQYPGAVYTSQNKHGGIAACTDCHSPHTGSVFPDSNPADPSNTIAAKCGGCHNDELTGLPVANFAQLEESRQFGFEGDIDGNGTQESLNVEIAGLRAKLLAGIQSYATNVVGTAICFDNSASNPNRFYLDDGSSVNGRCGTQTTEYNKYTPRLLRAAYNYMIATNDFGAWAHNPRYAIEVIYDAIADLNIALAPLGKQVPNGKRAFNGHFGAADAASPYSAMLYHGGSNAVTGELIPPMGGWSAACGQCHGGAAGLTSYLAGMPAALTVATPAVPAMQCNTCHTYNGADMKGLRSISKVYFPPQKNGGSTAGEVSFNGTDLPVTFALCGSCHSARENMNTVDLKGMVAGTFNTGLVNMHYLGAAATVMGSRTHSWYEYAGKTYTAFPAFWKSGTNGRAPGPHGSPHGAECTGCHQGKASKHSFEVDFTYCATCHVDETATGGGDYRLAPKEEEFLSMKAELLAALDAYVNLPANQAAFQAGNGGATALGLCYDGNTYGYLLVRKAAGCSTTAAKLDLNSGRAGYNLHWMNKDPGAWAHNEFYAAQLAYDSIVGLGGTPTFKVAAVTSGYPVAVPVAGDPLNRGY
jgi:hypothetical protein